jgi:hypothetical protein
MQEIHSELFLYGVEISLCDLKAEAVVLSCELGDAHLGAAQRTLDLHQAVPSHQPVRRGRQEPLHQTGYIWSWISKV